MEGDDGLSNIRDLLFSFSQWAQGSGKTGYLSARLPLFDHGLDCLGWGGFSSPGEVGNAHLEVKLFEKQLCGAAQSLV